MAKSRSTNKKDNTKEKNIKKNVSKKIDNMETTSAKELFNVLKILFVVIVVLSVFYLLTVAITGNSNKKEEIETAIQYDEILAGSSFSMRNDEYIVVYYDFSDAELTDITSQINSYSYTGKYRMYTVNMDSGFNKSYASEEKSNKKPEKAEELLINGPTLIKFKDGKVSEYIEGSEDIIDYLK